MISAVAGPPTSSSMSLIAFSTRSTFHFGNGAMGGAFSNISLGSRDLGHRALSTRSYTPPDGTLVPSGDQNAPASGPGQSQHPQQGFTLRSLSCRRSQAAGRALPMALHSKARQLARSGRVRTWGPVVPVPRSPHPRQTNTHRRNRRLGHDRNANHAKANWHLRQRRSIQCPRCASAVTQQYYRKFRIAEAIQNTVFRSPATTFLSSDNLKGKWLWKAPQ